MKIIVGNQKGGVGKSTLCFLLANYFCNVKDEGVLCLDFDPQLTLYKQWKEQVDTFDNDVPYQVLKHDLTEGPTVLEQLSTEELKEAIVFIDVPGNLSDDDLIYIYQEADVIICPFHYDEKSFESTYVFSQVMKDYLEARFEKQFHDNSYGYRPLRSAHEALEQVRKNVRKRDWVIDMDIKGFFDEVSHELLMKALERHVDARWVKMYIKRWLEAPIESESKELIYRTGKGTPQGGVISPLLVNLFLHYVFDKWLEQTYPNLMFVRYADDIIVHCSTKEESEEVLASIKSRMAACQLPLHEGKTKIVFCKKFKRRSTSKMVKFDFLGFSFQPRPSATKSGRMFLGYDCAISHSSKNKIISDIKSTKFQRWTNRSIEDIADFFNTKIQGWINYYGKFRKYKLNSLFRIFEGRLIEWARRRYKRFNNSYIKASKWFYRFKKKNVRLFVHWERGFINA